MLLLLPTSVFAEASFDTQKKQKTFLLMAPGTVTGNNKETQPYSVTAVPTISDRKPAQRQRSRRYKYVGESKKFRQFGQKPGHNNPWFQDYTSGYPRHSAPLTISPGSNPWQLDGMPPLGGLGDVRSGAYSANLPAQYGPDQYSGANILYPDFPDGIYRDSNPASDRSLPGNNNGFMPGFGKGNFGLPFSPFGMF